MRRTLPSPRSPQITIAICHSHGYSPGTANGGEHALRKSTLIRVACAPAFRERVCGSAFAPANVCGCELSVPNQHFRNAGHQPSFLKCSTGYRPGYYPALQADQIVERLLRRLTPQRGVKDCTLTNKLLPASRPLRSVPFDFTMHPPKLASSA